MDTKFEQHFTNLEVAMADIARVMEKGFKRMEEHFDLVDAHLDREFERLYKILEKA